MFNQIIFNFLGGVSLLLYGLNLLGEGLQIVGENKLRSLLNWITGNPFKGLISGIFISLGLQSSNATTVMLVGFTSAGLLTLNRVVPLLLGANIGSTLTVQLLAFHILDYALLIVSFGFSIHFVSKSKKSRALGSSIIGFGFIFLGLKILMEGLAPIKESEQIQQILLNIDQLSLWGIIFSAILTALFHSSAATIGILIALSSSGMLSLSSAIPIIIGANIGTCASGMISSIGEKVEARRVAFAHSLFKITGGILLFPLITPFAEIISTTSDHLPRQIANAHTIFNILIAVIMFPFCKPITRLIKKAIPPSPRGERVFSPKFLDKHVLESPLLALGQATREVLRMGDIVQGMVLDTLKVYKESDMSLLEDVESRDDRVDCLDREIKLYITKITEQELSEEMSHNQIALLSISNDLENIGDIIDKNIMELAKKKIYKNLKFSKEGFKDIIELHGAVLENFTFVMNALATQNPALAELVANDGKHKVRKLESRFRQTHIRRLQAGHQESIETSSIHMDLLTNFKRINSHLVAIARTLL